MNREFADAYGKRSASDPVVATEVVPILDRKHYARRQDAIQRIDESHPALAAKLAKAFVKGIDRGAGPTSNRPHAVNIDQSNLDRFRRELGL